MTAGPLRIGVLRSMIEHDDALAAVIEARVVAAEVRRRLGDTTFDLRVDGAAIDGWGARSHAAWPAEIDVEIDLDPLLADATAPLAILFGRTLRPDAVDVRRRMLIHIGLLGDDPQPLDRARAHALRTPRPRPTDAWIIATHASEITADDPLLRALASDDDHADELDAAFDQIVEAIVPAAHRTESFARLSAERDDLVAQLAAAEIEQQRSLHEAVERVDALTSEVDVLRERLRRAEIDRPDERSDAS